MKMKKFLALGLSVAMMAGCLTACGGSTTTTDNTTADTTEETDAEDLTDVASLTELPDVNEVDASKTRVSGSLSLDLTYLLVDRGVMDNLYEWYIDEVYAKEHPLVPYQKTNSTIRYIYTGKGANLFNFDRFEEFSDISGNFAEEEIRDFLEKGYLYGNIYGTFTPDQPITRGDFVVLLDSVYVWEGESESTVEVTNYRDFEDLGSLEDNYAKAIQRGLSRGYIEGYDDNSLRPLASITYGEVELIMKRLLEDEGFTWSQVATSIQENKGVTSTRWSNSNEKMTKAEAVYLLTYFQ